jgi:hypothetical protein
MEKLLNNPHMMSIQSILRMVGERVEGNFICDISPDNFTISQNLDKIANLQVLSRGKNKICEIGVNACHSLLIMLLENPNAEYLLFDLNYHKYTEPCIQYIKSSFPKAKITIIYGNSVETVKKYIETHIEELNTYDLCHIDGGHTDDILSNDFYNIKLLSKASSPVIFDDSNYENIYYFLKDRLLKNEISVFKDENLNYTNAHFIYSYL